MFTKRGDDLLATQLYTILENFIALCQPAPEISITKNLVDKDTVKQTYS